MSRAMSRSIWLVPAFVAAVAPLACGASATSVRRAHEAQYDAPFATVWNVVSHEVRRRYVGIRLEDPVNGRIETDYRVIESTSQDVAQGSTTTSTAVGVNAPTAAQQLPTQASLFRMTVQILGPPYKVSIDGVAARWEANLTQLIPYQHGAIDEPPWVQARIDNLALAIYDQLKEHAIAAEAKPAVAVKVVDTTPWANLPDRAAVAVIGEVHKAAVDRNAGALRPYMIADFRWADGADSSADTAIAIWAADPTVLRTLARTLDSGCAAEASGDVVCPTEPSRDTGRARFRSVAGSWKLVEFLR
jgi:hypothetical protein